MTEPSVAGVRYTYDPNGGGSAVAAFVAPGRTPLLWPVSGGGGIPSFTLGVTEPDATNSGFIGQGYAVSDLTVVTGDQSLHDSDVPSSGVIEGKYYKGYVSTTLSTKHLTFRNCFFEGRIFTTNTTDSCPVGAMLSCNGTAQTVDLEYCKVWSVQPRFHTAAVAGAGLGRVYRCDIGRGDDNISYLGYPGQCPNVNVQGCYLHHPSFWDNDPQRASDTSWPGATHNDLIQTSGSINGFIYGNSLHAYADLTSGMPDTLATRYPNYQTNSVFMMTVSSGAHANMLIGNNWTYGGFAQIQNPYQSGKSYIDSNSWTVTGNRFGLPAYRGPYSGQYSYQIVTTGTTGDDMGHTGGELVGNVFNPNDPIMPSALQGTSCDTAIRGVSLDYRQSTRIAGT